jgi:hypothetical protein
MATADWSWRDCRVDHTLDTARCSREYHDDLMVAGAIWMASTSDIYGNRIR